MVKQYLNYIIYHITSTKVALKYVIQTISLFSLISAARRTEGIPTAPPHGAPEICPTMYVFEGK